MQIIGIASGNWRVIISPQAHFYCNSPQAARDVSPRKGRLCLLFVAHAFTIKRATARVFLWMLILHCLSVTGRKQRGGCEAWNTSPRRARRRLKRTVIIPGHKSCSASEFSLSSCSPPCPVWAIFSFLVQRGSSDVVATWIWGLCHSCRLEQHHSYKLYTFLLPQLQNTSCSAGNCTEAGGGSQIRAKHVSKCK